MRVTKGGEANNNLCQSKTKLRKHQQFISKRQVKLTEADTAAIPNQLHQRKSALQSGSPHAELLQSPAPAH